MVAVMNASRRSVSAARMLAWRVHSYGAGVEELRLESARIPPLLAPDELLVRVRTASINPIDVAMLGGYGSRVLNALRALDGADVEFPLVPGRDFVGDVVSRGACCSLRVGQRVWGVVPPHRAGSHAQFVSVREQWAGAAPLAFDDPEAGGALYAGLSACAALRAAGMTPGTRARRPPRVLLLGLGGVGHIALQLLVHMGAEVVVGCSGDVCDRAISLGAAAALDRSGADYDRHLEDAGPFEAILDCAGAGGAEAGARRWRFSRFVTLSSPLLRLTDERGLAVGGAAAAASLARDSLAAARLAPPTACPPHVRWAFFAPSAEDILTLSRLADGGKLSVCVERVFPWRGAVAAYERAARGSSRGKLLLDFTSDDWLSEASDSPTDRR